MRTSDEITFSPGASRYPEFTIADLCRHLRRYSVFDGLGRANVLSKSVAFGKPPPGVDSRPGAWWFPDVTVTQWDLALVAKELVLSSGRDYYSNLLSVDHAGFKRAMQIAQGIKDPTLGNEQLSQQEQIYSMLRISYLQFKHQDYGLAAMLRTFWIFDQTWLRLAEPFDLEEAAIAVYGMPLRTLVKFVFAIST